MQSILILIICYTVVHVSPENAENTKQPAAFDEEYLFGLQRGYIEERKTLKRIDELLASKWNGELDKILIEDLDSVEPEFRIDSSGRYNTLQLGWLLGSGSTSRTIEMCFQKLLPDIVTRMSQSEMNSLYRIFRYHIQAEAVHEETFDRYLESSSHEQVPFRKFMGWNDFVEMMFQNRTPDALGDTEGSIFKQGEGLTSTYSDRFDPAFVMERDCYWRDARALHEAPNDDARFAEFTRQIRDSVNQKLGHHIVRHLPMNATLSRSQHEAWMKAREEMALDINDEVAKLRTRKKDAQWLCEHAGKLAYQFSEQQAYIFLAKRVGSPMILATKAAAEKSRKMEVKLEGIKDVRQPAVKILSENLNNASMCFESFVDLVENHHRFDIAMAVSDERHYNYPIFFCKSAAWSFRSIGTYSCKCIGTFCTGSHMGLLLADQYILVQEPDGTFKVVSNRPVTFH